MNAPPPTIAEVRGRCNSEDREKPSSGIPRRAWFFCKPSGGGGAAPKRGYAAEVCGGTYGRGFGSYPMRGFGLAVRRRVSLCP